MSATGNSRLRAKRSLASESGYTLLELLVVLVVLALLSGLAVTSFPGRTGLVELQGAARQIVALIGEVRWAAAENGQAAVLSVDDAGQITVAPGGDDVELPEGVTAHLANASRMDFYPDGSSTGGRLALRSGEHRLVINVGWLDSSATIESPAL